MKATFQISGSFQLTRRGLVATGEIISGKINTGDNIEVDMNGKKHLLEITGIDFLKYNNQSRQDIVGLVLQSHSGMDLSSVKLVAQLAEVYLPDEHNRD